MLIRRPTININRQLSKIPIYNNTTLFCYRRNTNSLVLLRLFLRLPLPGRYLVPLQDGVPRRRGAADGRGQAARALHELNNLLHRLPVSPTAGFPLPIHRLQLHTAILPSSENIPVLGVHGPHRAPHELSKPIQIDKFNTLFISDIPLERVLVPYNI